MLKQIFIYYLFTLLSKKGQISELSNNYQLLTFFHYYVLYPAHEELF